MLTDFMTVPAFKESILWRDKNDQVKVYAYGKLDDMRIGGDKHYGLFHGKLAVIDDDVAFIGTHNSDPRSRDIDSEMGGIFYGKAAADQTMAKINTVIADSYEWGSDEWVSLRFKGLNALKTMMSPLIYVIFRISGIIYQL
jgi:phosphatidylserine/phosphatidylglycerophosphate/cardiolipin synthase-like enzyme